MLLPERQQDGWSFYIFSGGGSADELFFRDFDPEFFQEVGGFVHFLASQGDQIQAGGPVGFPPPPGQRFIGDRKSTRLNSSHLGISYAVFCLKKKEKMIVCPHAPLHALSFTPPSGAPTAD